MLENNLKNLNCLFIPANFPTKKEPHAGAVFKDHLAVASDLFHSVAVLANLFRHKGIQQWRLNDNTLIYEGTQQRSIWSRADTIVTLLQYIAASRRIIKKHRIDVIYAHSIKWAGFVAAIIARLNNKPFILFIHSATPEREKAFHLRIISKIAIDFADHVFFVSSGQCENYSRRFNISSKHVVGNPVDTNTFNIRSKETSSEYVNILFAGRPTIEKGFPVLLDLIDRVINEKLNVTFTILTDLNLLSAADKKRLVSQAPVADFKQYYGREEFCRIINASDFLICLSQFESFSYVIAETLACGKPVVATECDGPRELVSKRNGILIPVDNIEEAYNGMMWMKENYTSFDPEVIRNDLVSRFSMEKVEDRIITFLTSAGGR